MNEGDLEQTRITDKRISESDEAVLERELRSLDGDAVRVLEALNVNSFENALYAFDEFLENITLFNGANNFEKAANALDIASQAFTAIDANHDFVMTSEELNRYLAEHGMENVGHSLEWLASNFAVLQRLSFFMNGITRHEIDAARDLFHGLNYLNTNLERITTTKVGSKANLSEKAILKFVDEQGGDLEEHDARGLRGLAKFLTRLEPLMKGKGKRK